MVKSFLAHPYEDLAVRSKKHYLALLTLVRKDIKAIKATGLIKVEFRGEIVGYAQNALIPVTIRRTVILREHCRPGQFERLRNHPYLDERQR